ncbi:MAG TPA: hypothetical protein VF785_10495, partial [Gemmatimonadaceae bacterium]
MTDRRGVGYAVLAAVLFGASAPVAKSLLHRTSPELLAGLLYLGSGAGLAIVTVMRRDRSKTEARIGRRDIPWLGMA